MTVQRVLLAGGSGVVGSQIAKILKRRQPHVELIIAGRRIEAARAVAEPLGAEAVTLDVDRPELADRSSDCIVVGVTNDLHDRLLSLALSRGHPYVDITRWTERLKQALVVAAGHGRLAAPVVFASAWMASTTGLMARAVARTFATVERIDIDVLYAMADQAGPNSTAYMDRLSEPFDTLQDGRWIRRKAFVEGHEVEFGGAGSYPLYRFDTPDQAALPQITGAVSVDAWIGFDDRRATGLLHWLVRSGLWSLLARPSFDKLRQSLLYNPGPGAPHRIRITITGRDATSKPGRRVLQITDPAGQTHLTALGAVLQVENLLGAARPFPGIYLGEAIVDPAYAREQLQAEGVSIVDRASDQSRVAVSG